MTYTTRWLPCLRFQVNRWWLPRSLRATETISHILLRGELSSSERDATVCLVADCFKSDPPLMIFAALSFPESHGSLHSLADWFTQNATRLFASGDAFLHAPQINATGPLSTYAIRWLELEKYFQTIPMSQWMSDAHLWLEVTGDSVPNKWRGQWAEITIDSNSLNGSGNAGPNLPDSLGQLARRVQHFDMLAKSFDARLQKSKLASLKELAYGLSHEINNPLANISTRASQLQQSEREPARFESLQKIVDQVYRAHEMIADLMFYANPSLPGSAETDLAAVVREVTNEFLLPTKSLAIRLHTEIPVKPVWMSTDPQMIAEAIRVLMRNSIEAIGSEGTIIVSMNLEESRVRIHVADSGPGLSSSAREHAFDPYFSGREAGRGLGLGLCRAYRIAKLHHGDIKLAGGPSGCVASLTLSRNATRGECRP